MRRIFSALAFLLALLLPSARAERLLILSDLHFTADSKTDELLEAVCALLSPDDALLVLGDMANSGREAEHARVLSFLAEIRTKTGCPVFALPGNHDLSGGVSPSDFAGQYRAFGYDGADCVEPGGAGYARFLSPGLFLVMLDTNDFDPVRRDVQHGGVTEERLVWLKGVLSAVPEGTETVVCGHYPILPAESGSSDDTKNAAALVRLLKESGVRVYLCGHRHSNYTQREDGLRQIAVGIPFAWPACAGSLARTEDGFLYEMLPLYAGESETMKTMREQQLSLARRMAEGSLAGTAYEGDGGAVGWFVSAFLASMDGTLAARQKELLSDANCEKWRRAEVRSMAKPWILSLVQNPPEDVKRIEIR